MYKIILCVLGYIVLTQFSFGQSYEESLRQIQAKFHTIDNVSCTFVSFARLDDRSEEIIYKYYFRKPASVRMEIQNGKYEGTILLYTGGDVRLKLGHGILSWFSFSFDRSNKIVCDLRGNGIHQSDWGWFIEQHLQMISLTVSSLKGMDIINGRQTLHYELLSEHPEQTKSISKEDIWIDNREYILIQYKQYNQNGIVIQSGVYKDIILNTNMSDTLFSEFFIKH